mgnify:CR=1 FL=1
MKKVSLIIDSYLKNNEVFNNYSLLNRDYIFDKYIKLKEEFQSFGYDISTSDINNIDNSDFIIYINIPKKMPKEKNYHKSYLILMESSLIRPDNFILKRHDSFRKIFTWDDFLVDNVRYFKSNFAHFFPKQICAIQHKNKKLCVLVAGNKNSPVKDDRELYSKRKEAIRWFEKNHLDEFSLYGIGWDEFRFSGPIYIRALNRVAWIKNILWKIKGEVFPSYRGKIENKKLVMSGYKFSICYENARDMPGYITEKIFDSFFAGCVPVYWGADNISKYVPENCFVDKRIYSSYEELYDYLEKMSDIEYNTYLYNIQKFIESDAVYSFSSKGFAKNIVKELLEF